MALMLIEEYRETHFTLRSRPSVSTVKRWVDAGDLYGVKMGGRYYVDPTKTIPVNDLVSKVISHDSKTEKARQ